MHVNIILVRNFEVSEQCIKMHIIIKVFALGIVMLYLQELDIFPEVILKS